MPEKNRIDRQKFTCANNRFRTNTAKGYSHSGDETKGSVFKEPLLRSDDGCTLWLEHVCDTKNDSETFWLMWHDADVNSTVPMSSVIDGGKIKEMASRLAMFIDL
jgi:hypothetical protein